MDRSIVPSKNSIRGSSCLLAALFDSATFAASPTLVSIGVDAFISALATPFASGRVFALAMQKGLIPIISKHKKAFAMTLLIEQVAVMNSLLKIAYLGIREYFFTNSN